MWVLIWVLLLAKTLLWGGFDPIITIRPKLTKIEELKFWFKSPFKKTIEVDTSNVSTEQVVFCKLAAPKGMFALTSAIAFSILHTLFIWNRNAWLKVLFVVCCLVATCCFGVCHHVQGATVKGAGEDGIEAGPAGEASHSAARTKQAATEQAATEQAATQSWFKWPFKTRPHFNRGCLF